MRSDYIAGGGEVTLDHAAVRAAELSIAQAADVLDADGADLPRGDFGEAGALINAVSTAYIEAASQLVTEAKVIALAARVAAGDMARTDVEQAVDFLQIERR